MPEAKEKPIKFFHYRTQCGKVRNKAEAKEINKMMDAILFITIMLSVMLILIDSK
jgi:hypothetical protein